MDDTFRDEDELMIPDPLLGAAPEEDDELESGDDEEEIEPEDFI